MRCIDQGVIDPILARAMIAGYSRVRALSDEEKVNLPKAMHYVSGASMLWFIEKGYEENARWQLSRARSFAL